jgi:uncharacterized membrane protein
MFQKDGSGKVTLASRIAASLRKQMIRGLVVVIPLGVTVYALQFCYDLTAGYLAPFIREITGTLPEAVIIGVSIALFLGLLFVLGVIAAATAGRRIIFLFEFIIRKIPLVKSIYGASKQVVEVLSPKDAGSNYEAAVLVDFPFPGVKSLAFVTGRLTLQDGIEYYRVFVPTTPNPTSGYLEIFPKEFVHGCGLSVEDAVKAAMSAGILMPEAMKDGPIPERELSEPSSGGSERPEFKAPDKPSYWSKNKAIIRNRLLSGLLLLVPLASTVVVVRFIYGLTVGRVTPFTRVFLADVPQWAMMGLTIIIFVAGLWMIGAVATVVLGQRIIALGEYLIQRIPMVSAIYGASKQIVGTLAMQNDGPGSGLEAPVLVEFPYPGVRALGFLMGRVRCADGTELCKIFMPTAPNISVGLFLMYRTEDVWLCGLSVDDAIRMVVSLGILCPDRMTLTPVGHSSPGAQNAVVRL